MSTKTTAIALADIRIDGGTQPRTGIDEGVVQEYATAILAGDEFPPLDVFVDGTDRWLASGFHRYFAHKAAGAVHVFAVEHAGTRRDAILFAVGTNAQHGLRRSNEDKRRAVRMLLEDAEWGQWSDREIASRCRVDHKTVAKVRAELQPPASGEIPRRDHDDAEVRKFQRGGKMHEQRVAKRQDGPNVATPREQPTSGPVTTTATTATTDDDGPSAAELLDDLNADLRKAEARVADLEKALTADGKDTVVKLSHRLEQAERARDDAMAHAAATQKSCNFYERQLARCGKAVGQRDLDKIAPAVEAFVRAHSKVAA